MISMVVTPLMREFEPDHRPSRHVSACGEAGGKTCGFASARNTRARTEAQEYRVSQNSWHENIWLAHNSCIADLVPLAGFSAMADTKITDPFPHLPRRPFFTDDDVVQKRASVKSRVEAARESLAASDVAVAPEAAPTSPPGVLAKEDPAPALKRGRPSLGEPWKAEGVSKRTWYRRQKKDAGGG